MNNPDEDNHLQHIERITCTRETIMVIVRIQSKTGSDIVEKLRQLIENIQKNNQKLEKLLTYQWKFWSTWCHNRPCLPNMMKFTYEYFMAADGKNLAIFLQTELLHQQDFSEIVKQIETSLRQFISKNFKMTYKIHTTCPALFTELMQRVKFDKFGSSDNRVLMEAQVLYSIWTSLIQEEADVVYSYKSLSTFELLDFLIPIKPKKVFDMSESKKESISKQIKDLVKVKFQNSPS